MSAILAYLLMQARYALTDVDKVLALTQGLPASYSTFLVTLDTLESPTFDDVLVRFLKEETHQSFPPPRGKGKSSTTDTSLDNQSDSDSNEVVVKNEAMMALAAAATIRKYSAKKAGKVYCHRCGGIGHLRAQCPSSANALEFRSTSPSPYPGRRTRPPGPPTK
jgi:hypothetical protein